jgi:hypothetical protein
MSSQNNFNSEGGQEINFTSGNIISLKKLTIKLIGLSTIFSNVKNTITNLFSSSKPEEKEEGNFILKIKS